MRFCAHTIAAKGSGIVQLRCQKREKLAVSLPKIAINTLDISKGEWGEGGGGLERKR